MAHLEGSLPTGHRYCSAVAALDKASCSSVVPAASPCCRSSVTAHPPWIPKPFCPQRCQWISHCLCSTSPAWKRLSASGRSVGLGSNAPVLVREGQDGFYYRGTVKEEIESERGMFQVEFAKPLVSCGRNPVCVQKTAKDDIVEYVNGMKHSLLPGDKVLAPWEADMARYGPGTVLTGIETRDPLKASEDEEIIVQFWNNRKVKLPRGVALWIPPSLWERTVEMIHMPFTSRVKPRESPDTKSCIFSCSPKAALIPVCAVHGLTKHCWLCSPCWSHFHYHCGGMCCSSAYVWCTCCCHPHADARWPLPSRSLVFQSETEDTESSSEPSPHRLELKGLNQEAAATVAPFSPSSDSEWDLQPFPTKSTVVDSAVQTGSSCLEKPRLKDSARPERQYWKSSHHKSHPSNSGLGSHSSKCTKGKMESKAIPTGDMSSVAPTDQSAMFETIEQSPRGQLTKEEVVRDEDFKLSLRPWSPHALEKLGNKNNWNMNAEKGKHRKEEEKSLQEEEEREWQDEHKYCSAQEHQGYNCVSAEISRRPRDLFSVLQEEGFAASEKQRYKTPRKKKESDDKCKVTCAGDAKFDDTDHVRTDRKHKDITCNKAERDMLNQNLINLQLMKFRS